MCSSMLGARCLVGVEVSSVHVRVVQQRLHAPVSEGI